MTTFLKSKKPIWGYLSRVDGNASSEPIELNKETYTFGRVENNDFRFEDNFFLSSKHASIEIDVSGKAWFVDNSTNGSLINLKEKVHKKKRLLVDGDVINLVYRIKDPIKNVAFKFVYKKEEKKPMANIMATQAYNIDLLNEKVDLDMICEDKKKVSGNKREIAEFDSSQECCEVLSKKQEKDRSDKSDKSVNKREITEFDSSQECCDVLCKKKEIPNEKKSASVKGVNKREIAEFDSSQESYSGGCKSKIEHNETKKIKTQDKNDEENNKANDSKKKDDEDEEKIENKPSPKKDDGQDDLMDIMLCAICSEIMHNCVCLQPCVHSFCAGCYSEWMEKSDDCPICRKKVKRISKNHIVNNIIEVYLRTHPDKKRSDEELKRLDERSKITDEMIYPKKGKKKEKKNDDEAGAGDEAENSDSDSDSSDSTSNRGSIFNSENEYDEDDDGDGEYDYGDEDYVAPRGLGMRHGFAYAMPLPQPFFAPHQPYQPFACRQCPQNKWLNQRQPLVGAPDYTCTPFQNHLLCQCCLEPFPDRNNEIARDPLLPKQNCSMCLKSFCHLYWGCRRAACRRCLSKFADLNVDVDCLPELIGENKFESELFAEWLRRTGKTIVQVFDECKQKLVNKEFDLHNVRTDEALDKVVCRQCGIKLFRELAYQYRRDLPKEDIDTMKRPDCYYGKNCRTQKHNLEHSKKYNHICEQTKF